MMVSDGLWRCYGIHYCSYLLGTYRRRASHILLFSFGCCRRYPCHPCHPTSILPRLCSSSMFYVPSVFLLQYCIVQLRFLPQLALSAPALYSLCARNCTNILQIHKLKGPQQNLQPLPNNIMLRLFVKATKFATGTDVHMKLQNVSDAQEIRP